MSHVLRQMLMSTSVAALMVSSGSADAYIVNGFSPPVVADFAGTLNSGTEYYRVGGSASTFDDMFTFSRSGNATMNALGWAAHNLLPQLSSWSSASNTTLTGGQTDPDAGSNAVQFQHTSTSAVLGNADTLVLNETYVFDLKVKLNSGTGFLRLSAGSVDVWYDPASSYARGTTDTGFLSSTVTDLGSSWYRITLKVEAQETSSGFYMFAASADGSTTETTSAVFHTYQVHAYRGSRVGMAKDATSGDTYVATTTSAVAASDQALLAWAPHNIAVQSQAFATTWSASNITVTSDNGTDPDGGGNGDLLTASAANGTITQSFTAVAGDYTAAVWLRRVTGTGNIDIAADNGTWTTQTITSSWALYTVEQTLTAGSKTFGIRIVTSGDEVEAFGFHLYRSDLAGMALNPDRSDRYVPTTSAAVYQARRNHYRYNGTSYVNKGILLESEARTNLCTHSNEFSNAAWAPTSSSDNSLASGQANAITGQNDAWLFGDDNTGGTNFLFISDTVSVSTSTTHTFSVFAKANGVNFITLSTISFSTPSNQHTWFNLGTGEVGTTGASHTARIEEVADGWYRCSIAFTTDASDTSGDVRIYIDDADNADRQVDIDGTSSVYIYGAQFEAGATPSSYIPTSGATVTRAAETLTIAGANMSASTTAMSFHHQGEINYADEGSVAQQTFWRWQTDASNYLSVDLDTDSTDTGEVNANQADGGTVDTVTSDSYSPGVNVAFNIATRNTNGAINLAVGGTAVTEDSTPVSLNDASSDTFELGYDMMGTHALFRQWAADIGDTGIESATS